MFRLFIALVLSLGLISCKKNATTDSVTELPSTVGEKTFSVAWTANKEVDVNKAGGGYRIYYSFAPISSLAGVAFVDVPYVSGPTAPVTATVPNIAVGTYYIRVVAYSAYNPLGLTDGNLSEGSSSINLTVN